MLNRESESPQHAVLEQQRRQALEFAEKKPLTSKRAGHESMARFEHG